MLKNFRKIDIPGWIALTWAVGFGILYGEMVLRSRAPGVWMAVRGWILR